MTEGLGLTAADVAAVTRNNDNNNDMFGGNCWIWIILIAFVFLPMMGMMGGGNRGGVETGVQDNFISDEFVKRDIFNTNQNVSNTACQTQKEILQSRYDSALMAQTMQAQMAQCLKRFFEAIKNLFAKKVNAVGTYA